MLDQQIIGLLDHTLLKPCSTWAEIETVCQEAMAYHTASVCIPPSFVSRAKVAFPQLNLCTVVGFPLGYTTTATKVAEAAEAVANGASEIDMVINLGWVKEGEYGAITEEIARVKQAIGGHVLKVIIETCYLNQTEKEQLCACVSQGGGDYLKTSTGFGSGGAQLEDIALFQRCLPPEVKIKAAGGIKTAQELRLFAEAGCSRIGSSSGVRLLQPKTEIMLK